MHQDCNISERDSSTYKGLWAITSVQDEKKSNTSAFTSQSKSSSVPSWTQDALRAETTQLLSSIGAAHQAASYPTAEWTKTIDDPIKSVVPRAYIDNWFRLYLSDLPERVFTDLFSTTYRRPAVNESALSAFLSVWDLVRGKCAEPVVSVSPKGDVVVEWVKDMENSLVLMASRHKHIHFSLFDKGMPVEGVERAETAANLIAMLEARDVNPLHWTDANEA